MKNLIFALLFLAGCYNGDHADLENDITSVNPARPGYVCKNMTWSCKDEKTYLCMGNELVLFENGCEKITWK